MNDYRLDLVHRPRRLRVNENLREMVAETDLRTRQLVQGHFVIPGEGQTQEVASLPGVSRYTADQLIPAVERDLANGVRSVMLFGVPDHKDAKGSGALDPEGEVPNAVRLLKTAFGDELTVMADVCLCPYTDHGHCGFVEGEQVVNDSSVATLAQMAVVLAEAGVDFVGPSDMMDGRISEIRHHLDEVGFDRTAIIAYSAKYASAFYGPFRDAAGSSPSFGDRRSYQMDHRNPREAIREVLLDLEEGADMVMVKPALAYLDIIRAVREVSTVPVAAYNVSGEYSMVQLAVREGLADERAMVLEILGGIRRAGADLIITYHASRVAAEGWLS
ncbi:MAG: porphobilinogen synthase [Planctomycetes bacterium]|nr:porphobilinogen synthase [Planctomycetota bacterium]MCP4769828.1 porphobilinogen synthase [Planctomycetota bacterium]MCP4859668.1 porphobilinogen synthase [Planctomycetota bacterium]